MIKHHSPAFNLLTARICIHGLNSMITSIETSCFSPVYIQMMLVWLPHDVSTVTHHEALDIHCGLGLSPTSHQVNSLHIRPLSSEKGCASTNLKSSHAEHLMRYSTFSQVVVRSYRS